ncbi:MAG: beta-N-acetylglucosaminidase, partial [Candidatus Marinimicrobia bacterium]|nr:beta-N-acetylglucosaminidase [Candidatus Neomarinimicrobiota bacterium]
MRKNNYTIPVVAAALLLFVAGCSSPAPVVEASPWAQATLKKLSLREKIGQMMVYTMMLNYYDAESEKWQEIEKILGSDGIGSLHVWGGDVPSAYALVNEMQSRSKVPMFIQADLEYGIKSRFKMGTEIPWPMAQGATGNPDMAYAAGRITAEEGRALGINLALAPIVDVNNNPLNPIINTRAYGEDPAQVIAYATRFMDGLHDGGMLATAKHFPGHGDTQSDSHTKLAQIPEDADRLWSIE